MALTLYAHPFSSYCQKVLTALYENGTPFEYRALGNEGVGAELAALGRSGAFPFWWTGSARWWRPPSSSSIWACTTRARRG